MVMQHKTSRTHWALRHVAQSLEDEDTGLLWPLSDLKQRASPFLSSVF